MHGSCKCLPTYWTVLSFVQYSNASFKTDWLTDCKFVQYLYEYCTRISMREVSEGIRGISCWVSAGNGLGMGSREYGGVGSTPPPSLAYRTVQVPVRYRIVYHYSYGYC